MNYMKMTSTTEIKNKKKTAKTNNKEMRHYAPLSQPFQRSKEKYTSPAVRKIACFYFFNGRSMEEAEGEPLFIFRFRPCNFCQKIERRRMMPLSKHADDKTFAQHTAFVRANTKKKERQKKREE